MCACVRVYVYLMNVLLHSKPLFVADRDATVPPLVVVAPLFRVAEYLLGVLQCERLTLLYIYIHAHECVSMRYIRELIGESVNGSAFCAID